MPAKTVFIYNKANTYGLAQDVKLLERAIKSITGNVRMADPLEPPSLCDLAVHFEVPIYGWMPWARRNVFVVNPEWWEPAWNSYLSKADALIFKCGVDRASFFSKLPETVSNPPSYVLPWTSPVGLSTFQNKPQSVNHADGFVWFLGASKHKRAAAEKILPLWKSTYPPLTVYSVADLSGSMNSNVTLKVGDVPEETRHQLQAFYPGHLILSESEALGLAAHEGQLAGAFLLGNSLPTYREAFGTSEDCFLIPSSLEPYKSGVRDTFSAPSLEAPYLDSAVEAFIGTDLAECRARQKQMAVARAVEFQKDAVKAFTEIVNAEGTHLNPLPPQLDECPPISVITLLHNRRRFVDLAFHNLLITDYPKDKIEWVVIEDSDIPEEQASDKVLKFARECSPMSVSYIPLDKKNVPIGSLRNRAIKKAQHDIILFMDDDDHYPSTSFRRRVAWLTKHPWASKYGVKAVCCTTIACYDLLKGTSAVNTPPWSLGLKERVSEATMCFYKSWWAEKPFPTISMAEGEGFVEGREEKVLEIPPQQSIVAMSHGKNASSRKIPEGHPSCFWGFPKEFLVFLHKLAGVEVEEIGVSSS
jgi:hypothetical protein